MPAISMRSRFALQKNRPPKPASVKALVGEPTSWDTSETGWSEVETMAHCGGDMGGVSTGRSPALRSPAVGTELRAVSAANC